MSRRDLLIALPVVFTALMLIVMYVEHFFPHGDQSSTKLGDLIILVLSIVVIGTFVLLMARRKLLTFSVKCYQTSKYAVISAGRLFRQSKLSHKAIIIINIIAVIVAIFGIGIAGHRLGLFQSPIVERLPIMLKGKPDLVINQVISPPTAVPGETMTITFIVMNLGTSSSGAFSNEVFLADTPYGTENKLGSYTMTSVPVGNSIMGIINATIPPNILPGPYWITVLADGLQTVSEANENNNISQPTEVSIGGLVSFNIGDRVRTTNDLNVRIEAGFSYPEITAVDYPGYAPTNSPGVILTGPLSADGTSWWKVQYDSGFTGWSIENWLEVIARGQAPVHIYPSKGASTVSTSPTLQWQAVSGATRYGLYVSKPPYGEANLVYENESIIGTSLTLPTALEGGVTYRWNMRAGNDAGWGPFSSSWSFTTAQAPITLTLYTHENSAIGPAISGATITGQDGGSNSFSQVTNTDGYATITGVPGTWSFTTSKSGYQTNSWSQSITATETRHAYLMKETASPFSLTLVDVGISSENKPWPPQTFLQTRQGGIITTWYTLSYSGPNVLVRLKTTVLDSDGEEIGSQLTSPQFQIFNPFENPIRGVGVEYKLSDEAIPGTYDVKFSIWNEDDTQQYDSMLKSGWLVIASDVTLTLYVHENSASGPVISGAMVTGQDGAGNSFSQTTNSNGYVTITGVPGTWSFTASKSGYQTNSWSQSITATETRHAYLVKQVVYPQITGVIPSQPTAQPTRQWLTILGNGFVSESQITLRIGGSTYVIPTDRTQFTSSSQIKVYVGLTDASSWSAQVTNPGGYQSNIFNFQVVP